MMEEIVYFVLVFSTGTTFGALLVLLMGRL